MGESTKVGFSGLYDLVNASLELSSFDYSIANNSLHPNMFWPERRTIWEGSGMLSIGRVWH